MPPVTKAGSSQFRKDVAFAATKDSDEFELEATGIVMVPDKADLQNDYAREETIRSFADQFATFAEAGQAGGGIMHAVWPDGWMELTRNEVLDEAAEIGDQTVDAGAWVQTWGVTHADLAELIREDILSGYSIGAIQVAWDGPFEQDEVDDVDTSELPDDELVWELTDGIIREVSAVDIPAVPDAQILEAAKDYRKRLADHVGNQEAFIEEAMERGHTEAEAERLWDVLNEAVEAEGAAQPGTESVFARAGKAFLRALTGADDDEQSEDPDTPTRADVLRTFPDDAPIPDDIEEFEDCVDWAEDQEDIDDPENFCGEYWEPEESAAAKEGQTLSQANRESAMAAVDANLELLQDAGVDVPTRFTDRDDTDFDLTEHQARSFDGDDDMFPLAAATAGDGGDADTDESTTDSAPGGDTPDDTTDMSNDPDGGGDDKTLAEKNAEQIDELTDAVKTLTEAVEADDDPADKTTEVELPDGSVAEISKAEAMSWFDDDGGSSTETPDEKAATKADIEALHSRLDSIVRESAGSQQLDRSGNGDDDSSLDELGKALS